MDLPLTLILLATAAALGSTLTYVYLTRRSQTLATDLAVAQQKTATAEQDAQTLHSQLATIATTLETTRQELSQKQSRIATLEAQLAASHQNLAQQTALLDDAHARLTQAFATVSRDALEKSNASFLQMAEAKFKTLSTEAQGTLDTRHAQIGTLLKPIESLLSSYQKRLAELESQRTDAYAALRQQIGVMSATQAALSTQTTQLISALTKPSVRGQWGEVALRRLVELAGMTARCDFTEQPTVSGPLGSEDGRLRPDMVVHLPANRHVVVDCKTVLAAFLDSAAASSEGDRQTHLKRHAGLVRARAKELAGKAYWSQFDQMPEFVVLFLPGEAFLYAACEQDPALIEDLMASRVILATPTTLIALLKSIEYGWRQHAVSENADEIRRLGAELYDRLATLAENMAKTGQSLEAAVDSFNRTIGTLESRVLVSARKMAELGSHTDKTLPELSSIEKIPRPLSTTLFPG